jgi:DNA-binding transcriptional ArsR family regulator
MTMGRDDHVDAVFEALADATRRRVMSCLADLGSASPTEIASRLPVTRQAVSKHLLSLGEAGLVTFVREGRETQYRLTPGPLTDAMSWMADVGAEWDQRLAALRSHLQRRRR